MSSGQVLVLTSWMEPHRIVPWQKAITITLDPDEVDREFLFQVLLAREQLASTGVGDGIAAFGIPAKDLQAGKIYLRRHDNLL